MISLMVVAGIVGGFLSFNQYHNYNYDSLAQTNATATLYNKVQKETNDNDFQYEYYYRPECKHCQMMSKEHIIPKLRTLGKRLTVINVDKIKTNNNKLANDWFNTNNVKHTPTLVVRSHGRNLFTYSGTNLKIFEKLVKGINPDTNQPLVKYPKNKTQVYQDDFTKTHQSQPASLPTDLGE